MVCKRSLLVLLLLLSSVVLAIMKNINYTKLNSMRVKKLKFESERKSKSSNSRKNFKKSTFFRKTSGDVCGGGMGFEKTCLNDLPGKITGLIQNKAPQLQEYTDYIEKALNLIAEKMENQLDFCVGDFTGKELSEQTALKCDVIPYKEDVRMSTIAVKVAGLSCDSGDQSLEFCFTYDKCGSFGFAFNSGIPICIATSTGVGAIVAPFLKSVTHVGFAFNMSNNIVKEFNIFDLSPENKFEPKAVKIEANIFIALKISLTAILFQDFKIGENKLSDIFEIDGSMTAMLDYRNIFTNMSDAIAEPRKGTEQGALDFIKAVFEAKAEVGLNVLSKIKFNLSKLTDGFLPDIDLGETNLDFIATLGGGNTGLSAGVYVRLQISFTFLTNFYNLFKNL